MTPQEMITIVLGTAVIWGAASMFKKYLDHRREIRALEAKNESEKQFLNTMTIMSQEETKRMEIFQKVIDGIPQLKQQQDIADDAKAELLKSLSNAKNVEFADINLDQEMTKQLSTNARKNL
ncbi:hypothetical protein [Arsenophonus sp. PmNCSU2021_1]|uniref:hypothetical protein n=1 Tax=Arsenophonus sp. PmNCSU2021_1 TaxID=3118989 RepID=UPI002FEF8A1D